MPCAPGSDPTVRTISRTSANCGNVLAGRNEPTSKCRTPAPYSSPIQRCFAAVDGKVLHHLQAVPQSDFTQDDAIVRIDVGNAGHASLLVGRGGCGGIPR